MFKALKKKLKDQRGLTLVELLAVIVILGIIAAIAVPSIGNVIAKSREDAIKADALQILDAARLYLIENEMPTGGITDTHLEPDYIDSVSSFGTYTVTLNTDNVMQLDGEGSNSKGGEAIDFQNATKEDINNPANEGEPIIPKPAPEEDEEENTNN
ncbi:type IV pilin protein [Bacillus sp. T33-2]|uniref:type IV pilin protein n=1 Tax=Bacillus sp. T33-2 TaxID=2054168 RepID=UPI000C782127|nr:prepilin-type N-terminal cleavage/methylation domain-containing protein [Bacillus sp. T33-2]PLR93711.1 prepilin-type cleavage/methylation domain-containing protein [Bacillus sp. T33-2]